MKTIGLILFALLAIAGCVTPWYSDGTAAGILPQPDRCDPRGACNVGKRP